MIEGLGIGIGGDVTHARSSIASIYRRTMKASCVLSVQLFFRCGEVGVVTAAEVVPLAIKALATPHFKA